MPIPKIMIPELDIIQQMLFAVIDLAQLDSAMARVGVFKDVQIHWKWTNELPL